MKEFRRYEILLPRRFNDGRPVPATLLRQTFRELEDRFGAVSGERQTILGAWRQGEKTYRDVLVRMFVDVPRDQESETFFQEFKETLKERFQQLEIWVTSHDIRVL
jgi:2-hydroxy-3-keto-5-methylthiopentenyl-1-phosphate phosphatase